MLDFILLLIIGSLWIWGVFALFDEGNLLWPVRKWADSIFGEWTKPVFSCPYCMSSIHGLSIFYFAHGYDYSVVAYGVYVMCLCGLNFIIKEYLYP